MTDIEKKSPIAKEWEIFFKNENVDSTADTNVFKEKKLDNTDFETFLTKTNDLKYKPKNVQAFSILLKELRTNTLITEKMNNKFMFKPKVASLFILFMVYHYKEAKNDEQVTRYRTDTKVNTIQLKQLYVHLKDDTLKIYTKALFMTIIPNLNVKAPIQYVEKKQEDEEKPKEDEKKEKKEDEKKEIKGDPVQAPPPSSIQVPEGYQLVPIPKSKDQKSKPTTITPEGDIDYGTSLLQEPTSNLSIDDLRRLNADYVANTEFIPYHLELLRYAQLQNERLKMRNDYKTNPFSRQNYKPNYLFDITNESELKRIQEERRYMQYLYDKQHANRHKLYEYQKIDDYGYRPTPVTNRTTDPYRSQSIHDDDQVVLKRFRRAGYKM